MTWLPKDCWSHWHWHWQCSVWHQTPFRCLHLPHPTAFDPWPTQPHTRRQTCSLDCNVCQCGWAPSCFSARGSAASQVTLMMPRTKHLCAPLLALCLPLLVPFLWIHRLRFQWLGHDGPGPLSHRASALWNPLIPCFPGRGRGLGLQVQVPQPFHPVTRAMPTLPCPKWVSPTIGTESAPVGVGVCRPGCPPQFVWERGTASGAFGPLGGILGQKATKKNNFGPKLLGQLFGPAVPPRGAPSGAQWSSWVQGSVGQVACGLPSRACPLGWVWVGVSKPY